MNPQKARDNLLLGHSRFQTRLVDRSLHLPEAHAPIAAILTCSDARVSPEILFDQPLGSLFVVRSAGQVADLAALGSLEYAAWALEVPLLVVMGHTQCGAVGAALNGAGGAPKNLAELAQMIRRGLPPQIDDPARALEIHVENTIRTILQDSPLIRSKVETGALLIQGALYDVASGNVTFLESHG